MYYKLDKMYSCSDDDKEESIEEMDNKIIKFKRIAGTGGGKNGRLKPDMLITYLSDYLILT